MILIARYFFDVFNAFEFDFADDFVFVDDFADDFDADDEGEEKRVLTVSQSNTILPCLSTVFFIFFYIKSVIIVIFIK